MGESNDSVTERLIASNAEVVDDAQVEYGPVGERAYAPEDEQDRDVSNDPSEYAPEHGMPWFRVVVELTRSELVLHPHNAQTCGHKAFHVVRKLFLLNVRESLRNPCIANYALSGCTKKACMAGFTVGGPGIQFMRAHIQSWEEGSLYALSVSEVPDQGLRTFPLVSTNSHFRGYSNGDVTDMKAILNGTSAEVPDGDAETPASDMDPEGGHSAPYTIKDEARYFSMGSDGSGHPYVIELYKVSEEGKPQKKCVSQSPTATILFLTTIGLWLWALSAWSTAEKAPDVIVNKVWAHCFPNRPITDAWELGLTLGLTCALSFIVGSISFLILTWILGVNPWC